MTEEEAQRIADEEGLSDIVWFEKPASRLNCVAVYRETNGWIVSTTDERAVESALERFDSEGEALSECVARSRAGKVAGI